MATAGSTAGLRGNTPNYEYVTSKQPVISGAGATRTLLESESGSVVLLDRFAGTRFTLPVAVPGTNFTFLTNVTNNSCSIITNISSSTPIIIGDLVVNASPIGAGTSFQALGADLMVKIAMNGTTTGGQQGSRIVLTALSSGTWFASGLVNGTGTLATPFSALSV